MKRCPKCKKWKRLVKFSKDKSKKGGLASCCKLCRNKYNKKYRKENKKHCKEYQQKHKKEKNKYNRDRYKNSPKIRLNNIISRRMYHSLKGNKEGKHWEIFVDYSLEDLIKHLKKTLPKGTVWQDFLDGKLHLDHIIPISIFNFDSYNDLDFKRCWSLKNLQLLEATKNLRKNKTIDKPFQPNLKI